MTANDRKALLLLARMRHARSGAFGEAMSTSDVARKPQCYARSGYRVLNRLVKLDYAARFTTHEAGRAPDWGWRITDKGRLAAREIA